MFRIIHRTSSPLLLLAATALGGACTDTGAPATPPTAETTPTAEATPGVAKPIQTVEDAKKGAGPSALMRVKPEDKVVTINDVTLMGADYIAAFQNQARAIGLPPGKLPVEVAALLETPTVDQMEKRELLVQESRKQKLAPAAATVDAEIAKIKAKLPKGLSYEQMLARFGATDKKYREGIDANLAIGALVKKTVREFGKLDDAGAKRLYEQDPERWKNDRRVDLHQIIVAVAPDATVEAAKAAREKAESIRIEVMGKSAKAFEKVAKEKSEDERTKANGGALGKVAERQLLPNLVDVAFGLKKGAVSSPVRTGRGFHLLRSSGVSSKKRAFAQVKDEILLVENRLRQNKAAEELIKRLRNEATIVRHVTPVPLPEPPEPPPPTPVATGTPNAAANGTVPPHGLPPPTKENVLPGMKNPHGGMAMPPGGLPPPTKENVLPGMKNPHGGGGGHAPATTPTTEGAPKLKLGG